MKLNVTESNFAIYSYSYGSVIFGDGWDLYCHDNNCYRNLGETYQLPNFLTYGSVEAQSFLGGSNTFDIVEIEVYKVVN